MHPKQSNAIQTAQTCPEQSTLIQRQKPPKQLRTFLNWNSHGTVSACLTQFRGRRLPRRRRLRSGAPIQASAEGAAAVVTDKSSFTLLLLRFRLSQPPYNPPTGLPHPAGPTSARLLLGHFLCLKIICLDK